jgi:hypothetical protein
MAEFERAHKNFLDQLSEEEKKQFAPIQDSKTFLSEVQNLGQSTKARKWTKLFTAIQKCSQCLTPYFEVVGIMVQSHPEWAAIAWGSFRLVLSASQLQQNHILFTLLIRTSSLAIMSHSLTSWAIFLISSTREYLHTTS